MSGVASSGVAGTAGGGLQKEIQQVTALLENLKVSELKTICRAIQLTISGRKAELQDRIKDYLKSSMAIGRIDPWRPKAVKVLIEKAKAGDPLPQYDMVWQAMKTGAYIHPVATGHQPVSTLQQRNRTNVTSTSRANLVNGKFKPPPIDVDKIESLHFKESVFYKLKKAIPESRMKIKVTHVRMVATAKFRISKADYDLFQSNKNFKLYLFSGILSSFGSPGNEPIQFPYPTEIKFNDEKIKDNVRGLKNKIGTANPADLTANIKGPFEQNNLEVIYASNSSIFLMCCYIVEEVEPEQVLQIVLKSPRIIKAATLHYIKQTISTDDDDDLITTSTVMSLQCPVSYTRMKYPAKSINCNHLQCFDALWYLHSQRQIPTWQCPVCQISLSIETLAICEYVDEILKSCSEDVEQVELAADGSWTPLDEDGNHIGKAINTKTELKKTENTIIKQENSNEIASSLGKESSVSSQTHSNQPEPTIISLDSEDESEARNDNTMINTATSEEATSEVPPRENVSKSSVNKEHNEDDDDDDDRALTMFLSRIPPVIPPSPSESNTSTIDVTNNVSSGIENASLNQVSREVATRNDDSSIRTEISQSTANTGIATAESSLNTATPTDISSVASGNPTLSPSVSISGSALPSIFRNSSQVPRTSGNNNSTDKNKVPGVQLPSIPSQVNNEIEVAGNSLLGLSGSINFSAPSLERTSPVQSSVNSNNILGISGEIPSFNSNSATNTSKAVEVTNNRQNSVDTSHNNPTFRDAPVPPGRNRKTTVSPFIPKKPYLNILPQKRHNVEGTDNLPASPTSRLRSTSPQGQIPRLSGTMAGNLGVSMDESVGNRESISLPRSNNIDDLDIIDLTSDD
ncbi:hypothetical protein Kpol_286p5 [Vanderwaltozyma polyspora DSM 70294]|uniref:E3 SUMO-protein transferase SIZ2 n=1 Tax=Vanderwaltozyma polyspora (strain ATCC 22028 / DSM 70294 / BCRC 21397 / CBS 2163 / NBRC 10782 / NRRL Y-8283 / UCD 57-17) TaxID=436907 RepID=A7TT99_VANPO|nr:uncharacterized protein Kpol_286p5 [Vanderwaltozyma polyspora DSM 70294]EDO14512.1 hypothetical protein Kpol_286p5 [Vanderwaltozyma polyspora DSM 70294]